MTIVVRTTVYLLAGPTPLTPCMLCHVPIPWPPSPMAPGFVGADAGVTMALSILVSSATILHWVFAPYRYGRGRATMGVVLPLPLQLCL